MIAERVSYKNKNENKNHSGGCSICCETLAYLPVPSEPQHDSAELSLYITLWGGGGAGVMASMFPTPITTELLLRTLPRQLHFNTSVYFL